MGRGLVRLPENLWPIPGLLGRRLRLSQQELGLGLALEIGVAADKTLAIAKGGWCAIGR